MYTLKKLSTILLSSLLIVNFTTLPCFANQVPAEISTTATSRQVIARYTVSASDCKKAYQYMLKEDGWDNSVATTLVNLLPEPVGTITSIATLIQYTNYTRTRSAFYSGWKSGKGCVMVVYDNEAPYVYAK